MSEISRLQDLSKDKNTVLERILSNQDICKAVKYPVRDFLDQPDVENPFDLIYDNIFPHFFIPETVKEEKTFITLSFRRYRPVKSAYKSGLLFINVFTHQNLYRTNYGFLRTDFIISEIDKLVNSKEGIGVGKPEFYDMDEMYINNLYSGLSIGYKLYEFN